MEFELTVNMSEHELAVREIVVSAMSLIQQELGIPTESYISEVPLYAWGHWLPSISLLLQLTKHDRVDLAIEHILTRVDTAEVFGVFERRTARNRLNALKRLERIQDRLNAGIPVSSDYAAVEDSVIAVCGRRAVWVNMESSYGEASCSRTAEMEMAFFDSPYVEYSRPQHQHLLFCDQCRASAPLIAGVFEEMSSYLFGLTTAQLEALSRCLDVSDDRVRRLAEIQAGTAVENTPQRISEALHWLAWRAITFAEYLALDLNVFLPGKSTENPWVRLLRGEGHPRAVAFVESLSAELLEAAFVALTTSEAFTDIWFDNEYNDFRFCIPTDGDLLLYDFAIEIRETPKLEEWELTLNTPPGGVYLPGLLKLLKTAALFELNKVTGRTSSTQLSSDIRQRLDHIEGLIASGNSLQMPIIELLDKLVSRSSEPSAGKAEEYLQRYLGDAVISGLVPDARQCLIGAEYWFMDRKSPDPGSVLRGIAIAFETQLEIGVDRALQAELAGLRRQLAPTLSPQRPGLPVQTYRPHDNLGLLHRLELTLAKDDRLVDTALCNLGFEKIRVLDAIRSVRLTRNRLMHGKQQVSYEHVRRQRERWYGMQPGTSNIFAAVVPSRAE